MNLYLDLIWLLNFLIDLMLLILTSIVLKKKTSKKRFFFGALFASGYVFFLFLPGVAFMMHPIVKGLYSVLIILITFSFEQIRSFFQALLMFYFVNFAIGGGLIGIHYYFNLDHSFLQGTFATNGFAFGSPVSWGFIVIGFPILYFYTKKRFEIVEEVKIRFSEIMKVNIRVAGITLELTGFVDSGNRLTDPFSKKPVMIIDMTKVKNQFPQDIVNLTEQRPDNITEPFDQLSWNVSIVPFRTVGSELEFLWTIKPDEVTVVEQGKAYSCPRTLVGLSYRSLGENGDYDCLLHPTMIQHRREL